MNFFRFNNINLHWKALIIFIILLILPTALFGGYVLSKTNEILKKNFIEGTTGLLRQAGQNLVSIISNVDEISSYMIYSDQFRSLMKISLSTQDPLSISAFEESVTGFTLFHLMSKKYINSIMISGKNGVVLSLGEPLEGDEQYWVDQALKGEGKRVWTTTYSMSSAWSNGRPKQVVSLFRQINDINYINTDLGIVRIRLNENDLYSIISKGYSSSNRDLYIVNKNGVIISTRDKVLVGKTFFDPNLIKQIVFQKGELLLPDYSWEGKSYIVNSEHIQNTDWYLVSFTHESYILNELTAISSSIKLAIVITTCMAIIAFVGFLLFIIRPIRELTVQTRKLEQGDFSAQVHVRSKDEIGILSNRFNKMVVTIQRLIETKYKLEISQKEHELKSLQNQINPHFLYNTLDIIRWTARMEKAWDSSRLIEHLSNHFRMSLRGGKMWTTVLEELQYVSSYLTLSEKRIPKGLTYNIYVCSDIAHYFILKQIIQPLVENSIIHGFNRLENEGYILIRCYSSGNRLVVDVIDNGIGIDPLVMNTQISSGNISGFALKNIKERLRLLGIGYSIEFLKSSSGTWTRLTLPLIEQETEIQKLLQNWEDL